SAGRESAVTTMIGLIGVSPFVVTADSRPADPVATPVSPAGQYFSWWFIKLVNRNGLVTQPSDQSVVATTGSTMTVNVPMVTTNANGILDLVRNDSQVRVISNTMQRQGAKSI
ncbi:Extracellular protein, partial [Lacticaseibacillus rhamnosus MTCC 5462]